MSYSPANSTTAFIPTYRDFQVDDEQLRIILSTYLTNIAYGINIRDIAQYDLVEILNGQQYFTTGDAQKKRFAFRKVFETGAIAHGAIGVIPHGITNMTIFTKISGGVVTDLPDYRPLPYVSITGIPNCIDIRVDATNILIANGTGAGVPNIVSGIVILEYLKN